MSKAQPRVCPPRLLLMSKHTVGEEIDKNDPSLPKEIQQVVKEKNNAKLFILTKLKMKRKLKAYAGIIGIDNSSLDKYLKISKSLRLHAILDDAGGFIYKI